MEYPTTDEEIASFWGEPIRSVFRWKGEQAPLHDYDAMCQWFSTRKNIPKSVITRIRGSDAKSASLPINGGTAGAAAALKRLEQAELQAFELLQEAIARGNPLEIRERRENWLRISESLRKYDLMIEQNRRDVGELVPVSAVKEFIGRFITYFTVVTTGRAESLTNELVGLNEELKIYRKLRSLFGEAIVTGVFGYLRGRKELDQRLATYAEEHMRGHYAMYGGTDLFEEAEQCILNLIKWADEQSANN